MDHRDWSTYSPEWALFWEYYIFYISFVNLLLVLFSKGACPSRGYWRRQRHIADPFALPAHDVTRA